MSYPVIYTPTPAPIAAPLTPAEERIEAALPLAAHALYADAYATVLEAEGYDLMPLAGKDLTKVIAPNPEAVGVIRPLLKKIEGVWGCSVADVFEAGDIAEAQEVAKALTDLFLGCVGHGVTLHDDFSDNIERAEKRLGKSLCDYSPVYIELSEMLFLAEEAIQRDGSPLPKR